MNGSLPPSSRTDFVRCRPAISADAGAGPLAAGQRHALHAAVGDDLLDVGDLQEDVGVDALGGAGVPEQLLQGERALRVQLGVLEQDRVAQHQVGAGHPDHLVQRVVPGLDGQQDADRLVDDDGLALHDVDRPGLEEARGPWSRSTRGSRRPAAPHRRPPGCACPSPSSPGRRTRPCARASALRPARRSRRAPRRGGGATRGRRHAPGSITPSTSAVSRKGNSCSVSPVNGFTVAYGRAPASLSVLGSRSGGSVSLSRVDPRLSAAVCSSHPYPRSPRPRKRAPTVGART